MLVKFILFFLLVVVFSEVRCEDNTLGKGLFSNELIEEGRTFAHRTLKKLAIILPAIFFKLGISFTLLLLVTIVAVNNGFIGFLLLIVGMSTVLARLQEARKTPLPVPFTYPAPLPILPHYSRLGRLHYNPWDRSDDMAESQEIKTTHSPLTSPVYQNYISSLTGSYAYGNGNTGNVYGTRYLPST